MQIIECLARLRLQACVQTAREIADKVTVPERSILDSMGGTPADRDVFAAELRQLPGGIASSIAELVSKGVAYHNSGGLPAQTGLPLVDDSVEHLPSRTIGRGMAQTRQNCWLAHTSLIGIVTNHSGCRICCKRWNSNRQTHP